MNDLISRSELIEKLWEKHKEVEDKCYCYTDADEVKEIICGIVSMIDEQPTAYSVEKVVDELESELKKGNIAIDFGEFRLFEIVKRGGVSDDVCEWRLCDEEANVYDTSCRNPHILIEGTPKENGYRYCPYCSKKIKVAE